MPERQQKLPREPYVITAILDDVPKRLPTNPTENTTSKGPQLGDVSLGSRRTSLDPAISEFEAKGVPVTRKTLSRIRSGDTTGGRTKERLLCSEVLQLGSVTRKDHFYLNIAQAGIDHRISQQGVNAPRLSSKGFTEDLAASLSINPQELRRYLRAMRVGFIFDQGESEDDDISLHFRQVVDRFFNDFTTPGATNYGVSLNKVMQAWDYRTVRSFYRTINELMGARAISTWVSYEMEAMGDYYQGRLTQGSPINDFDRVVLQAHVEKQPELLLISRIRNDTGIKVDSAVIYDHRHLLIAELAA